MEPDIVLQRLPPDAPVRPGDYYFGRIDNAKPPSPQSYGIIMVVTPDLLPLKQQEGEAKAKNLVGGTTVYPCWVMGRSRFNWMPKSRFYSLHESQADMFTNPEARHLFTKYYEVATGDHSSTGIDDYTSEILVCSEEINARNSRSSPLGRSSPPVRRRSPSGMFFSGHNSNGSDSDIFGDNQERRKRARGENTSPATGSLDLEMPPTPTPSDQPTVETAIPIKTEDEECMQQTISDIPKKDLVIVYVGRTTQEHHIPIQDLAKSPVLTSWIHKDADCPYIMHPNLRTVNNQHFASIIRFMHKGEYLPNTTNIPTGFDEHRNATAKRGLNGLRTSGQYSAELVRAGHLYQLAEKFQVDGLTEHIHKRVTQYAFREYSHEAMLKFARIIFCRPGATTGPISDVDGDNTSKVNKLEEWTLRWLAYQFQPITKDHCTLLYNVIGATGKSRFFQRLLRTKANQVDNLGGEPDYVDD